MITVSCLFEVALGEMVKSKLGNLWLIACRIKKNRSFRKFSIVLSDQIY